MAALRPLLSIAREETAIITSELANAASSSKLPIPVATIGEIGAGRVVAEMGGVTMKRAGEIGMKDGAALGDSILSQHLSLSHAPHIKPSSILQSHPNFSSSTSTTQSIIASAIEEDAGQTIREVLGNAGQTGVEDQMDKVVEVAKVLAKASSTEAQGGEGGARIMVKGVEEALREVTA